MTAKKPPEENRRAKLEERQVRAIFRDPSMYKTIAERYGVSIRTIMAIKSGKAWKHLKLGKSKRYKELERAKSFASQDPKPPDRPQRMPKPKAKLITQLEELL